MAPSNADFDRLPTMSNYAALTTGVSADVKDQEIGSKIKDLIQNQPVELDQFAPPKPHHSLKSAPGHKLNEDSNMEGIVSISAATLPYNNISSNEVSEDYEFDDAQSSLNREEAQLSKEQDGTPSLHKIIVHEPPRENSPNTNTFHNHHHHQHNYHHSALVNQSLNIKIGDINGYGLVEAEDDGDHSDHDDEEYDDEIDVQVEQNQPPDEKYRRIKRKLRQVLEENERMGQELDKSNRRVRNLRREKNLLLDRLCVLERRDSESGSDSLSSLSSDSDASDSSAMEEIQSKRVSPSRTPGRAKNNRGASNATVAPATMHQPKKIVTKSARRQSPAASSVTGTTRATGTKETKGYAVASAPSTITNVGSATQKPKRIHQTNKQRPGLSKVRKVQALEKDEAGNVKLPVTVGIITILNIGHVVHDREAFHNDRYIWPVGYKMSRSYNSMIDPNNQTIYTCSVIDDGEAPKFQIDAEDQPGRPIIAGTATGAWTHVVKAANTIRKRDHSNSASGPDYYGFSNATIAKMIQDLPGVEKCQSYIMQRFEEPSASTSAKAGTGGDKRKASALGSATKLGEGSQPRRDIEGHDAREIDENEDDEGDDVYASLGTPGKKSRVSSPKIRHAGFDAQPAGSIGKVEPPHAGAAKAELNGDETNSEPDPENDSHQKPGLSGEASLHFIAATGDSQPPIVVAAGDSELIDIEDHDSEVDVGMDEDISMSMREQGVHSPSTAPIAHFEDQEMAT
ncbi:hypothetical protein BGX27_007530 [Mortierella sp. AM989]|nr:hypothetical protein BGX27_007530 [Mortierella sp. AM989]